MRVDHPAAIDDPPAPTIETKQGRPERSAARCGAQLSGADAHQTPFESASFTVNPAIFTLQSRPSAAAGYGTALKSCLQGNQTGSTYREKINLTLCGFFVNRRDGRSWPRATGGALFVACCKRGVRGLPRLPGVSNAGRTGANCCAKRPGPNPIARHHSRIGWPNRRAKGEPGCLPQAVTEHRKFSRQRGFDHDHG